MFTHDNDMMSTARHAVLTSAKFKRNVILFLASCVGP